MGKRKFAGRSYVWLYSILVLVVTWTISITLFTDPNLDTDSIIVIIPIAVAMFSPALLALIFKKITYKGRKIKSVFSIKTLNKKSLLFGIFYPIVFIFLCVLIALVLNIGEIDYKRIPKLGEVFQIVVSIIINMIIILGEEYGWRGYLLPELTKDYGKIKATVIVGIVWALFHIPAIYLSAKASGMSNPLMVCIIQAFAAFVFSFSFSYCYYLSGNIIPVLIMHSIWNEINTAVLGSISSNNKGILQGNLLYINGEGIVGLVMGAALIYWFVRQFQKGRHFPALDIDSMS